MKYFSFRIALACMLLPPILYVLTIQGLEGQFQREYQQKIESVYLDNVEAILDGSVRLKAAIAFVAVCVVAAGGYFLLGPKKGIPEGGAPPDGINLEAYGLNKVEEPVAAEQSAPAPPPPATLPRPSPSAKPAHIPTVVRDNKGVKIRKNRRTGAVELIVDPFPEDGTPRQKRRKE